MGKKSKGGGDLGRAIARKQQRDHRTNRTRTNTSAAEMAAAMGRHTVNSDPRGKLQSVLDASDLEELMFNAALAHEDFVPERYPGPLAASTVVVTPLASSARLAPTGKELATRRELDRTVLRIPRRPPWDASTSYEQLMQRETQSFLQWRRNIAETEEQHEVSGAFGNVLMTPFEKNLEVWRQLWRVVERSDVVIQIVDARNPLLYYCEDLYRYVVNEMGRAHVLLLNKSDLLTSDMIGRWQRYFEQRGVQVIFFSAFKESVQESVADERVIDTKQLIERMENFERLAPTSKEDQRIVVGMCGYPNVGKSSTINVLLETIAASISDGHNHDDVLGEHLKDASTTVVSEEAGKPPNASSMDGAENDQEENEEEEEEEEEESTSVPPSDSMPLPSEFSSTRADDVKVDTKPVKRVGVSSTPGKTKHFQTLALNDAVMLCDCPGLVFPNFSTSKSELICAGILSIDQMRGDYITPVSLIASRIPASILEGVYGLRFGDGKGYGSSGNVSGDELLDTHARARGYMTDHGRPDGSRSARVLLKDFVNGRLVYAHGPEDGASKGESGVGPAVFAKKGTLVYERREVDGELETESKAGDSLLTTTKEGLVDDTERVNMASVKARVSGSKKKRGAEFIRVQRNYGAMS